MTCAGGIIKAADRRRLLSMTSRKLGPRQRDVLKQGLGMTPIYKNKSLEKLEWQNVEDEGVSDRQRMVH